MKLTQLAAVLIAFVCEFSLLRGQTNTFPSSGNVGIGTTSPGSYNLNIQGGTSGSMAITGTESASLLFGNENWPQIIGIDSSDRLYFETNGADYFTATWDGSQIEIGPSQTLNVISGNVGIGTTSPGSPVTIQSNAAQLTLQTNSGPTYYFATLYSRYDSTHPFALEVANGGTTATEFMGIYADAGGANDRVVFPNGNVGIGTTTPDQALSVNGTIHSKEVIVDNSGWPDYVFSSSHHLTPLSEVERTIIEQKHLPGMPSAKEVAAHGITLGAMQAKLLAQIEELTLRQIEQEKRLDAQTQRIEQLERENEQLLNATGL